MYGFFFLNFGSVRFFFNAFAAFKVTLDSIDFILKALYLVMNMLFYRLDRRCV